MDPISHEQIYERLCTVEKKVDEIDNNTKTMVDVMQSLNGAFKVLGWIGNVAKPFLWVAALLGSITFISQWRK
jgi:hypothetical protein